MVSFHPEVARWFEETFGAPTEPQRRGWPAIRRWPGHVIAAPTGSGKTLAAFLWCIDGLLRRARTAALEERTYVVYISPLKALSHDIHVNLQKPLAELTERLGVTQEVRVAVRTGDTPQAERQQPGQAAAAHLGDHARVALHPAHHHARRAALAGVETVIVDEIHALADDRRGAHLSISLERLDGLAGRRAQRIGLSATQHPIALIGDFLTGGGLALIVDEGHRRELDLEIWSHGSELAAVLSHEQWAEIDERIAELSRQHRRPSSSPTRGASARSGALAPAPARRGAGGGAPRGAGAPPASRGGEEAARRRAVGDRGHRLARARHRRRRGRSRLPDRLAAGHRHLPAARRPRRPRAAGDAKGASSRSRATTSSSARAGARAARRHARRHRGAETPLDVLAQQLVAMCVGQDDDVDELFALVRRAWPFRELTRDELRGGLDMLSRAWPRAAAAGRAPAPRRVGGRVRRGAAPGCGASSRAAPSPTAPTTTGRAIPRAQVGTVDEDFAIERCRRRVPARQHVVDDPPHRGGPRARRGRAAGCADHSVLVRARDRRARASCRPRSRACARRSSARGRRSRARGEAQRRGVAAAPAGAQLIDYLMAAHAVLGGVMPSSACGRRALLRRGRRHAARRARAVRGAHQPRLGPGAAQAFCRSFDFELQAAATDDGIVLSLGAQHSFPLELVRDFVARAACARPGAGASCRRPSSRRAGAGTRSARWRLCARPRAGKVPPQLMRIRVAGSAGGGLPAAAACQETSVGDIELPRTRWSTRRCATASRRRWT
jgi:ATP-dependent Lhr-like helicase